MKLEHKAEPDVVEEQKTIAPEATKVEQETAPAIAKTEDSKV